MTKVKAYIKNKLQELAGNFPQVEIVYAYNEYAEAHIVQLLPQKEYYNNNNLDNAWLGIAEEFMNKFPYENIGFVSDDANLISTEPEFKFNISSGFDNRIAA